MSPGPLACAWAEYVDSMYYVRRGQNQKGIRGKQGCGGPKALSGAEPGESKSPWKSDVLGMGEKRETWVQEEPWAWPQRRGASGEVYLYVTFL